MAKAQKKDIDGETQEVTTVSLADICEEMGIKPQSARIKLRKKMTESKAPGFRWVFPLEQKEEIMELLTPKVKVAGDEGDEGDEGDDQE